MFRGVIPDDLDDGGVALDAAHDGLERLLVLGVQELVRAPAARLGAGHAVEGAAILLPRLHLPAGPVPEVGLQLAHAGVQQVGVVEHVIARVIFGADAERVGLDAQVDVLRDQDDVAVGVALAEVERDAEEGVVGGAGRHAVGQAAAHRLHVKVQAPRIQLRRVRRQPHAAADVALGLFHQLVQEPAHLAHVARDLGHADLGLVEFLEHDDGEVDVVLVEAQDRGRVVDQDVGVENEDFAFCRHINKPKKGGYPQITQIGADKTE